MRGNIKKWWVVFGIHCVSNELLEITKINLVDFGPFPERLKIYIVYLYRINIVSCNVYIRSSSINFYILN